MYDHNLYVRTLSEFARGLLTPYDVDATLDRLAGQVTDVLGLLGSGVSLATDDRLTLATAYGSAVAELEQVQQRVQAGPCVTAFRTGEVVAIADLAAEQDRWPDYCRAAVAAGIPSVASLPLRLDDQAVGALDLYSREPRSWTDEDLAAAAAMADMACVYIINASHHRKQVELNEQLQLALDNRLVVEQAKGMVAARKGIGLDQAFDLIRNHARSHNAGVRDVCEAIIRLGLDI